MWLWLGFKIAANCYANAILNDDCLRTRLEFVCLAEISFALDYSGTQKWEETVASRPLVPLARFAIRLKRRRKAVGGVGIVIQRPTPVVILNTASGTGFIN